MLSAALAGLTGTPLFSAEDPLQPVSSSTWYHRRLTEDAAAAAGWSPGAAAELAWHAVGVDLYSYHVLWKLIGGPARWRGARWGREALARLHFDNLVTTADVEETWLRVLGGTQVAVEWAARCGDVGAARAATGAGLHAVQDFYSHSTWIDAPERRGTSWLESRGRVPEGLLTGGFGAGGPSLPVHGRLALTGHALLRLPDLLDRPGHADRGGRASACPGHPPGPPPGLRAAGPPGINLDSRWQSCLGVRARGLGGLDGEQAFDVALSLAARDTKAWLAELDATAGAGAHRDFWRRVRTGAGTDWTAAYDTPHRLPYQFLAAGRPLPLGRGDAGRWFLRIDRTGPARASVAVRVRDAQGRPLTTVRAPRRAVVVGPLPCEATSLQVVTEVPARGVRVHAFRRAPRPELHPVTGARQDDPRPGRGAGSWSAPLPG